MRRKGKKHGITSNKTIRNYKFGYANFLYPKLYENIEKKLPPEPNEEEYLEQKRSKKQKGRRATRNNQRAEIPNENSVLNRQEARRRKKQREEIFITYPHTEILKRKYHNHRMILNTKEYIEIFPT